MRSTRHVPHVLAFAAFLATCATAACTSLLGSYEVGAGQPALPDGSSPTDEGGGPTTEGGAGDTSVPTDAPTDSPAGCAAPKMTCGGSCVDLESDKDHCGSCGRSCLGGTCSMHVCQPFTVVTRNDVSARTLIATDTDLFFGTTMNEVIQQPVTVGSAPITLATAGGEIFAIAPSPPRLYFTAATGAQWQTWKANVGTASSGTMLNAPLNGTPVGLVAAGLNLHTQQVTSAAPESFEILACPLDGTPCFGNYNGPGRPGSKLAAGNGYVFWTDQLGGPVVAYPDAVGLRTTIAPSEAGASAPAWDGTTLFWVNGGSGKLRKSPYPSPTPSDFRNTGSAADDLLVDAVNVYWSEYNGTDNDLFALPKTAAPAAMPLRLTHGNGIRRLTQTANGIYWADGTAIKGIRKP